MQTAEVFAEMARWLRYAEEDLITAETLLAQAHIPPLSGMNVSLKK